MAAALALVPIAYDVYTLTSTINTVALTTLTLGVFPSNEKSMLQRKSYVESGRSLISQQILDGDTIPPMPAQMPRCDDDQLGISFFRIRIAEVGLEGLTLPRTFFGRSEISNVSFKGTDLSESSANWNDFTDVDFSSSDLSDADLRSSNYDRVCFLGSNLRGADLRHSKFNGCNFKDADMTGARLTREIGSGLELSDNQRSVIDWQVSGPEPEGG